MAVQDLLLGFIEGVLQGKLALEQGMSSMNGQVR